MLQSYYTTTIGTFNYYTYKNKTNELSDKIDKFYHSADIIIWIVFGSGINDKSSVNDRINKFILGTLVSAQYKDIEKWAKKKGITSIGYEELSEFNRNTRHSTEKLREEIRKSLKGVQK